MRRLKYSGNVEVTNKRTGCSHDLEIAIMQMLVSMTLMSR